MPNSQDFDRTSNSTLAKLLEVDSELAVTEADLLSRLESVQEKRSSLKTVISMFTKVDIPATASIEDLPQTLPPETDKQLAVVGKDLVAPPLETRATATIEPEIESAETESKAAKKTTPSSSSRNKTTKYTQTAKLVKRGSGWQQYVRDEFTNTSLPEAVYAVLQRESEQVFEIPAVVNSIFVDELPKDIESKVRRQVTNILSDGARKNKWYRGQLGQYSMSRAAAKANAA